MKVQDIRVGSIVSYYKPEAENHFIDRVKGINCVLENDEYVCNFENYGPINIKGLKPVALTPDILLQMNFENWGEIIINEYESEIQFVQHNIVGGTSNFKVCLNTSKYGCENYQQWIVRIDEDSQYVECNYVHQLQNICYLYTNVDLCLSCTITSA